MYRLPQMRPPQASSPRGLVKRAVARLPQQPRLALAAISRLPAGEIAGGGSTLLESQAISSMRAISRASDTNQWHALCQHTCRCVRQPRPLTCAPPPAPLPPPPAAAPPHAPGASHPRRECRQRVPTCLQFATKQDELETVAIATSSACRRGGVAAPMKRTCACAPATAARSRV